MFHESPLELPVAVQCEKEVLVQATDAPAPPTSHTLADPEQVRAVEAAFVAQDKESDTVAGLLGLWMSTLLLNDLAVEHFSEPAGSDEPDEDHPRLDPKD